MAIEYQDRGDGLEVPIMTACPKCDAEIPNGKGFVEHWPNCPENPLHADGGSDE